MTGRRMATRWAGLLVDFSFVAAACGSDPEEVLTESAPPASSVPLSKAAPLTSTVQDIDSPTSTVGDVQDQLTPGRSAYQPTAHAVIVWEQAVTGWAGRASPPASRVSQTRSAVVLGVDAQVIVAGTGEGTVLALDLETGMEQWSLDLAADARLEEYNSFAMYTAISGDSVFVAASTGILYSLDVGSGQINWEANIEGLPGGFPVVVDDTVVVARSLADIYDDAVDYAGPGAGGFSGASGYDARTGAPPWTVDDGSSSR